MNSNEKTPSHIREIYFRLDELCPAATLLDPRSSIAPSHPDTRFCPPDSEGAWVRLSDAFDRETLLQSGVVQQAVDGALGLAPTLAEPDGKLIFLRDSDDKAPADILTATG